MSHDDLIERIARLIYDADALRPRLTWERLTPLTQGEYRKEARAALSAMPQRLSPELIAQLTALASRLTAQGEYEAVDLIDTVVERVSAMPGRELLAYALEALEPFSADEDAWNSTVPDEHFPVVDYGRGSLGDASYSVGDLRRARAAADKIRAAMGGE